MNKLLIPVVALLKRNNNHLKINRMSNIITKAHPVPDMHSTGLRVVGAWLFAIVLILFSTVFVHIPYTREIQMVLAIPVLLFFGAPFIPVPGRGPGRAATI